MGDFFSNNFQSNSCLIILPQPSAPIGSPGSIRFYDTSCSLSVPASTDWAVGTGDFTVEWYQYQTDITSSAAGNPYQRVFSVDVYPTASLAISIELGVMFAWMANGSGSITQTTLSNFLNQWVHFAFVRRSGAVNIYQNGLSIVNFTNTNNISDSTAPLYIGAEPTDGSNTKFQGFITNLHFVNGQALYTASFSVPTESIQPTANTKLLLDVYSSDTFIDDSSTLNKPVFNYGSASWSNTSPYHP